MPLEIYGQDHSPWVQAVLLGVFEKGVEHTLVTSPPLTVFTKRGIMMPAASFDGKAWKWESADILLELGFSPTTSEDMRAILGAWRGVVHRPDNALRFFKRFSYAGDPSHSQLIRLRNNFLRSFAAFYFFLLLRFGKMKRQSTEPDSYGDQFLYWEDKLKDLDKFLGGDVPDTQDLMLFGIIQCHCSIPAAPVEALQQDPRLTNTRAWLARMQQRFENYKHLYTAIHFEPLQAAPKHAGLFDQIAFWLGAITMVLAFPITVPLVALLVRRIRKS